jgi:hypothetical protein
MSFLGGGSKSSGSPGGGGTKKQAKSFQKKKKKSITDYMVSTRILKGIGETLEKSAKKVNLKSRKKFISKTGLTKDDIRMDDDYLSSKEALAELRKQGYKTNQDIVAESQTREGPQIGNVPILGSDIQKTAVKKAPTGPTIAELELTEQQRLSKIKRRGRKATKLSSTNEDIYLSKKTLLG